MGYVRKYLRRLLTDKSEPREVVQILSDEEWDEVTRVALGFEDSLGVPPEYYRGYAMVFTPNDVEIKVMSYVGLLATYKQGISNQEFVRLKDMLKGQKIRKVQNVDYGMTGGSSGAISLMKGDEMLFLAHIHGNNRVTDGDLSFDGFLFESAYMVFPWLERKLDKLVDGTYI